jgi:hypothetical protein
VIISLLIFVLVLCAYQDVRFRGIHWIVFPLLLCATIAMNLESISAITILYNAGFLIVLMLLLTLYLSLKMGRLVNITKGYFSWGDILFLVAMIPLFSFQWYILFFTIGTCLSLILHLIASMIKPQKTVPYAGYMAMVGIIYLAGGRHLQDLIDFV